MILPSRRTILSCILLMTAGFRVVPVEAADAVDAEVHRLQTTWEAIKFGVPRATSRPKK